MRRRPPVLVAVLTLIITCCVSAAPVASAATPPQNPKSSARLPSPTACHTTTPLNTACTAAMLSALDAARKALTGTTYTGHLPKRFLYLSGPEQLLVLANSDRAYYGESRIFGFNPTLNASARAGVTKDTDPVLLYSVSGNPMRYAKADWASGAGPAQNPLFAYFAWMYADGMGFNLDCTSPTAPGCWSHRDGILATYPSGYQVFMGAAGGPSTRRTGWYTWTALFEVFAPTNTVPSIATVTTLSAYSVPLPGGQTFTVSAYGLRKITAVYVCGLSAKYTVLSSTTLRVTAPARVSEVSGHVTVHTSGGASSLNPASAFKYT